MRAWTHPELPVLPGKGTVARLHDTATGQPATSAHGHRAGLYVCGITPYDATHMGHANTYVSFDLLLRSWRDAGLSTTYVQNVTDVDDPLLERAHATGIDWQALAERETQLFRDDMTALRVLPPDTYLGATETVPWVVEAVQKLIEVGAAYRVPVTDGTLLYDSPGDVYFDLSSDAAFGEVSGWSREKMLEIFPERGGDPDRPGKRDPLDPLMWRAARKTEPAWDGDTLGAGRPGWHIECVAIALRRLENPFDVNAGGSDLVFPHHEMGASHAHVLTGSTPYARTYTHSGMVGLDGEKMSKSKGNLVLVSTLRREGVDPMAVRLALLDNHYRSDWSWTGDLLVTAEERLATWRAAVAVGSTHDDALRLLASVRAALAADLDAPTALALIDGWAAEALAADASSAESPSADSSAGGSLVTDTVDALLGVRL